MSSAEPSDSDHEEADHEEADHEEADHEETVVVERALPVDEATVVVDREASERTIAVDRSSRDDSDATVTVDRSKSGSESTVIVEHRSQAKAPEPRGPRGRQRINLPPVQPGFAERATLAAGPGAVESYAPRELPVQPAHVAPHEREASATRAPADAVPSVRRSSRRFGVIAIFGFVAACAVSVLGLSVIIFLVLAGL